MNKKLFIFIETSAPFPDLNFFQPFLASKGNQVTNFVTGSNLFSLISLINSSGFRTLPSRLFCHLRLIQPRTPSKHQFSSLLLLLGYSTIRSTSTSFIADFRIEYHFGWSHPYNMTKSPQPHAACRLSGYESHCQTK